MVNVSYDPLFMRKIKKIKDQGLRIKVKKQIKKIINSPESGKPMRHARKGTRELYIKPFRLSYAHIENEHKIVFLDLYHKDEQ